MTIHVTPDDFTERTVELLERAATGEEIIVCRDGDPIIRIHKVDSDRDAAMEALACIRERRKSMPKVTRDEIISWRDEGRKYK